MILSLLLVVMTSTQASSPTPDSILLKPLVRHEGQLASGQTHIYKVEVNEGDFVRATVSPRAIDVAVALVGPDGHEIVRDDVFADTDSAEVVMAVARQSGVHRLIVTSAKDGVPEGTYVVSLDAPHAATDAERLRVQAMRTLEAGAAPGRQADRKLRLQAVDLLERSRTQFHEAGDAVGESWALVQLAWNKYLLLAGDALTVAQQAVDLCRGAGDPARLSAALSTLGLLRLRNGDSVQARADLDESLALATDRAGPHPYQEARARNALGIFFGRTGEAERAIDEFRQVVRLARTFQLAEMELGALNNLGIASKDLGNYEASLEYYEQSLAIGRALKDPGAQANALNNMGNLYRQMREYRKALACHEQALAFAREVGNRDNEARALNTIGWTHLRLGEYREAIGFYEQALAIRRTVNDPAGLASTLDGLGFASHHLGDDGKALEHMTEALALRRRLAERYGEIESLAHVAEVKRDANRLDEALADIESAVQLADSLRGRVMSPDLRASFVAAEQERYELYIDTLMQLAIERPNAGFAARALEASERGRARVLLESLLEARADIREGIDPALLEEERVMLRRLDEAGTKVSQVSIAQTDSAAVREAENTLARLTAEYQALEARIRRESPRYAALTQPVALGVAEIQQRVLDDRTVLLEFALGEERSWLWSVSRDSVESFQLPPRKTIEAAARRLYALLSARQPRTGEQADARAKRLRAADEQWRREAAAFSRAMLETAAERQGAAWRGKRLLISAADVLAYLPFAALPDPLEPARALVSDHEIVYVPSATVLALMRQDVDGRAPAARALAILADPVFDADDPRVRGGVRRAAVRNGDNRASGPVRLPFSRQEAKAIEALANPADVLRAMDFDANRGLVTSGDLADYRIVHFATHGVLDSQHPRLSGLVLSLVDPKGRPQEGFVRLNDIYNLRLRAEVVVLSACQTALGKEIRGEGIVGITRGFMYAGARRVVASLWQVDDLATAEFMRLFYQAMLKEKLAPAAALRRAQRRLAAQPQWASPFFWSAFVIQGEWK